MIDITNIERVHYQGASPEFMHRLRSARASVAHMDAIDGEKVRDIPVILAALTAGLRDESNNAHFEALAMLEDLVIELVNLGMISPWMPGDC